MRSREQEGMTRTKCKKRTTVTGCLGSTQVSSTRYIHIYGYLAFICVIRLSTKTPLNTQGTQTSRSGLRAAINRTFHTFSLLSSVVASDCQLKLQDAEGLHHYNDVYRAATKTTAEHPVYANKFGTRSRPVADSGLLGAVVVPFEARTHCIAVFKESLVPSADKWLNNVMTGQTFTTASS